MSLHDRLVSIRETNFLGSKFDCPLLRSSKTDSFTAQSRLFSLTVPSFCFLFHRLQMPTIFLFSTKQKLSRVRFSGLPPSAILQKSKKIIPLGNFADGNGFSRRQRKTTVGVLFQRMIGRAISGRTTFSFPSLRNRPLKLYNPGLCLS